MQPKKKSMADPIIYGLCLVIVIYLAFHGAVAHEIVNEMVSSGDIESSRMVFEWTTVFSDRVAREPLNFQINDYTQQWLIYCCFGWLIVVLMIENSKKNLIKGKEYGTAKWGTLSDIKDLFAANIEKDEINRAKQTRWRLGRWKVKTNLYKKCEADGRAILNAKMQALKEEEAVRKSEGRANARLYKERQNEIREEVKQTVALAKRQAWLPDQLKADYELRLRDIDESPLFTESEKKGQKDLAKKEYEQKLKDFYNYAKRVQKIKDKYKDADMLFTKTEKISFYNFQLNQNTLILGGSGSGKTRGYVMPNVLQAHSSYIITDPKGEILEKGGYFLKEVKGYKIRVLNLDDKTQSDGYNPFVYVHTERDGYEERVLSLIEAIIVNTDGGEKKGGSDPFWDKAERLFLQAVFFFTAVGFPPEEQNMNTVLELIGMLQIAEEEDDMNSDLDIYARIFAERFGRDHIGVQQYREFREKASGKTAKSIVISAVARLAPFRTSAVKRIFSYDSMHLDRLGEEKTAIFVVVPPTDDTFNFIAGMLFSQMFQELQYCATQVHKHDGQRLPVPCRFILDEFANTCTIPNFVKILAYARSFGIGITPILQSLEQIKNMYKDEWGVIVDNCNTLLYLGSIQHMDTLEYMSKLLGKGTFDKKTTGRTRGKSGSSSENWDVVGRELMDTSEIRKIPKKDCLFIVGGRNPFYSEKYDYTSHPNYHFTSDGNREYSFHYTPEPPPEKKQAVEPQVDSHGAKNDTIPATPTVEVAEAKKISIDLNQQSQLGRLVKAANNLQPIPDHVLTVDDGESTERINEAFLGLVLEQDAKAREQEKQTVAEETRAIIEQEKQRRIQIELSLFASVNRLGRTFRNLEPISDEVLIVDDGEDTMAVVDEKVAEFLLEDSGETVDMSDIAETVDDITAMLSGFDFGNEIALDA